MHKNALLYLQVGKSLASSLYDEMIQNLRFMISLMTNKNGIVKEKKHTQKSVN